jgi:cyclic beta-1,2-glucan synthetase
LAIFIRRPLGSPARQSPWDNQTPIRGELFGIERLEDHARSLAAAQTIERHPPKGYPLARRLRDNAGALLECYRSTVGAIEKTEAITPAAEWLVDNYHLVERQISQAGSDLPTGFYRQLPKLASGPFAGYPRVFGLAWSFVAHTDSRFDADILVRYVRAYQEVQPLTIGELWAVSITLRIVLVENLRRLAEQTVASRVARRSADDLADRLLGVGSSDAKPIPDVLARYEAAVRSPAFAVQLIHRLRDQDPRVTPALSWLDARLLADGTSADTAVRDVHRSQGATNVSVRNVITSMRTISDVDWKVLFERTSLVDKVFAGGSNFGAMDFQTRNLYRSAVEELARGSLRSEIDVAGLSVAAAAAAPSGFGEQHDERRRDPGYHLLAGGRRAFEASIGCRLPLRRWSTRLNRLLGINGYAVAVVGTSAALLALPVSILVDMGVGAMATGLLASLGAIPAVDAATALVNRVIAFAFGATPLPALELRAGIPPDLRTIVAVPTLLTTPEAIAEQIERLEIHHLASLDGDLHFALLSDWTDAAAEQVPGDEELLAAAAAGIGDLNRRYGPAPGGARFVLLHRRRVWNEGEGRWIGWERKRGKLHELNRLLRGAPDTTFIDIAGAAPDVPVDVRYVVTLDGDTKLPRDTVRRLVGKMAHPLNRPRFDATTQRVVEGYAILQPRVTPSLPVGQEGSLFQRTFSSLNGIDPYDSAVSDVYQDLSGDGSYAGKGIYDVDAFETALQGRVPDSTLLSHDLFEGVFARAGLASDVEVVEEFPARYDVHAQRHHRWARGDWQLLPWIVGKRPRSPGVEGRAGGLPALGRWKMLDNLRRTLSAPAAVAALLAGWMLPLSAAAVWTAFVLGTIVLPSLIPVASGLLSRNRGTTIASHGRAVGDDLRLALTQSVLLIVFLAHQAWLMLDAVTRTLYRLLVTRRHLLEWTPAAQAKLGKRLDLAGYYRRMAGAAVIGGAAAPAAYLLGAGAWPLAALFAILWLASPAVARIVSSAPAPAGRLNASVVAARSLRRTARRTWRFFETFVTPLDHMLPPDNFQEDPTPALAHRTSPTNLGLYLLSIVSARDFGWIGTAEATERLEATFATMQIMQRFRGHFYNWYDTRDLRPLDPLYVSSVDSGNLAGHLIALANAVEEWRVTPIDAVRGIEGIADALDIAGEEAARLDDGRRTQTVSWTQLEDALAGLSSSLGRPPTAGGEFRPWLTGLADDAETMEDIAVALTIERGDNAGEDLLFWIAAVRKAVRSHLREVDLSIEGDLHGRLRILAERARSLVSEMKFGFLLDRDRMLLSIGYLVPDGLPDANCYDLLASEARLASFVAIAKGDIPARHWFRLGRSVLPVAHGAALISWSGSMFEYLMPSLVMRAPAGSLLEQTSRLIVRRQIDYATARGTAWGISESAYNARDLEFTYQYSNFGVPGLGLKRGLGDSLVIAPYASALAAMVDPQAAVANLARLADAGGQGRYGFYEALDHTPSRIPEGSDVAIVRAFMAHHQGMTIVAIADALLDGRMRSRFHAEPMIQATELLLQERTPRDVAVARPWAAEVQSGGRSRDVDQPGGRRFTSAHQATPATHLLSNGKFATMLTAAGSGYTRWGDIAVTRWREDPTCDDSGSYVLLRDVRGGRTWSAGFQPSGAEPDKYQVSFNEDHATFVRNDGSLTTTLNVVVSTEHDAEVRRVSVSNHGSRTREIEITSYAELVLARHIDDIAHPAFTKLFVETEYLPDVGAIVATRRRRSPAEPEIWAAHLAVVDGDAVGRAEIETDRARFLGRGRGVRTPLAMIDGRPLSGTVGTVLDPIFALRRRVRVAAGATVRVAFWTMVASTRQALLDAIDKQGDSTAYARATTLAWTQAQVQLHHLGISAAEAALFQRLAGHVIYAAPALRPSSDRILRGAGAQSGLWPQGISGDLPIVLLRISDIENIDIARQMLQAHRYWRMKRLAVDLVILNDRQSSYVQDLQVAIETHVRSGQSRSQVIDDAFPGRVFVLRADLMPAETAALLSAAARVVIVAQRGSLFDQLERISDIKAMPAPAPLPAATAPPAPRPALELEFFNGLGGFAHDGREYVTILGPGQSTPAPWINVIANPHFGFQVATEGTGFTWALNSRENQITAWSNDPVSDRPGEVFYIRDEDTGSVWTPTASPMRDETATYVARHGRGYSRFEYEANGVATELVQYVPIDAAIKISRLTLYNRTARARRLSVTAYVEWVLGPSRSAGSAFVTTEIDSVTGAMFARNPWRTSFGSRVAFLDMKGEQTESSGDRRLFVGRNRTLADPAALAGGTALSNTVGAGLDPCGAQRAVLELAPHGRAEIVVFLGEAADADTARLLIARYQTADLDAVLADVTDHWNDILGMVAVKTPDRTMDIMLNGWLLYQTLACRVWARSGFYQASGAYGFRDQLQDGMALAHARPSLTREHLLRAAARQFVEGDVQHWWLPHSGQGVRSLISDDRAWLAFATAHYVSVTGDTGILDCQVPFLEGQRLQPGEHDSFFHPAVADTTASLFEHCARALDHSLAVGAHGLPLIGTGDWNDGMNRVGEGGQGESVWLGWFLHASLSAFAPFADARGETVRAERWRAHVAGLKDALERDAWDGQWYRRGFFDDGTPFGGAAGQECRIDSLTQSWSVLSGAADPARAAEAMMSVERHLIQKGDSLALLFAPPFDKTPLDPGYIKGYPPGIRENGGQYTHAALWSVMAFAALRDGDRAASLFSLLNPVNHARTRAEVHRYKVEPYVVAADVYAKRPHVGRGGWTWYTGSAGWMQRAGIEAILGVRFEGGFLLLDPCIPKHWPGFEVVVRCRSAQYEMIVDNAYGAGHGIRLAKLDGMLVETRPLRIPVVDDGIVHRLDVRLG